METYIVFVSPMIAAPMVPFDQALRKNCPDQDDRESRVLAHSGSLLGDQSGELPHEVLVHERPLHGRDRLERDIERIFGLKCKKSSQLLASNPQQLSDFFLTVLIDHIRSTPDSRSTRA